MANQNPKSKKKDFFWLTVTVGACFILLISILVGRFMGNYLVKTLPKAEAIKMPESVPLPKGYTSLTPYTLLTGTAQTGLTPAASSKGATALTKTAGTTPPQETQKPETTPQEETKPGTPQSDEIKKPQEPAAKKPAQTQTAASTTETETQTSAETPEEAKPANAVYRIQLGAFSTRENAENLISDLKGKGFEGTVIPTKKDGKDYFRVQVGAYKNKDSAEKVADDLKQKGYPVFISGQ